MVEALGAIKCYNSVNYYSTTRAVDVLSHSDERGPGEGDENCLIFFTPNLPIADPSMKDTSF